MTTRASIHGVSLVAVLLLTGCRCPREELDELAAKIEKKADTQTVERLLKKKATTERVKKLERRVKSLEGKPQAKVLIDAELREDLKKALRKQLEKPLREELKNALRKELETSLRKELETSLRKELEKKLLAELKKTLQKELETSLRKELEQRLRKELDVTRRQQRRLKTRFILFRAVSDAQDARAVLDEPLKAGDSPKREVARAAVVRRLKLVSSGAASHFARPKPDPLDVELAADLWRLAGLLNEILGKVDVYPDVVNALKTLGMDLGKQVNGSPLQTLTAGLDALRKEDPEAAKRANLRSDMGESIFGKEGWPRIKKAARLGGD